MFVLLICSFLFGFIFVIFVNCDVMNGVFILIYYVNGYINLGFEEILNVLI